MSQNPIAVDNDNLNLLQIPLNNNPLNHNNDDIYVVNNVIPNRSIYEKKLISDDIKAMFSLFENNEEANIIDLLNNDNNINNKSLVDNKINIEDNIKPDIESNLQFNKCGIIHNNFSLFYNEEDKLDCDNYKKDNQVIQNNQDNQNIQEGKFNQDDQDNKDNKDDQDNKNNLNIRDNKNNQDNISTQNNNENKDSKDCQVNINNKGDQINEVDNIKLPIEIIPNKLIEFPFINNDNIYFDENYNIENEYLNCEVNQVSNLLYYQLYF